jgi:hypothetical protein
MVSSASRRDILAISTSISFAGVKPMKVKSVLASVLGLLLFCAFAEAENNNYPKAKVSFDDFKKLVGEVEPHRAQRLINLESFLAMSKEPGTIILDGRSGFRFERIHLKGAKHLSFTDFTQENLGKVIPTFETKILIYCNNNFEGNQTDFASKVATPESLRGGALSRQMSAQAKPLMMALNIPTYVNLYGYGYRNVYELNELVDVKDPRVTFEGTMVKR